MCAYMMCGIVCMCVCVSVCVRLTENAGNTIIATRNIHTELEVVMRATSFRIFLRSMASTHRQKLISRLTAGENGK